MLRPRAETMPIETEPPRPKGLPIAITQSPMRNLSELPNLTKGSGLALSTFSTARSVLVSTPRSLASSFLPSAKLTVISSASAMTWLLVTTMPDGSMTKPEPSDSTRRSLGPSLSFRRSSKKSCSGEPFGASSLGIPRPGWSTVCDEAMLTTASSSPSARSATDCGPSPAPGRFCAVGASGFSTTVVLPPSTGGAGRAGTASCAA